MLQVVEKSFSSLSDWNLCDQASRFLRNLKSKLDPGLEIEKLEVEHSDCSCYLCMYA